MNIIRSFVLTVLLAPALCGLCLIDSSFAGDKILNRPPSFSDMHKFFSYDASKNFEKLSHAKNSLHFNNIEIDKINKSANPVFLLAAALQQKKAASKLELLERIDQKQLSTGELKVFYQQLISSFTDLQNAKEYSRHITYENESVYKAKELVRLDPENSFPYYVLAMNEYAAVNKESEFCSTIAEGNKTSHYNDYTTEKLRIVKQAGEYLGYSTIVSKFLVYEILRNDISHLKTLRENCNVMINIGTCIEECNVMGNLIEQGGLFWVDHKYGQLIRYYSMDDTTKTEFKQNMEQNNDKYLKIMNIQIGKAKPTFLNLNESELHSLLDDIFSIGELEAFESAFPTYMMDKQDRSIKK